MLTYTGVFIIIPIYGVDCFIQIGFDRYEAGGLGFHSGAAVIPVIASNGIQNAYLFMESSLTHLLGHHLTLEDIKANVILGSDVHFAPTEVIALENTLNGTIFPQDEIIAISEFAHSNGVKMHLDGARIWHVAAETGVPLTELCAPFDSVSLCFSKGLGMFLIGQ